MSRLQHLHKRRTEQPEPQYEQQENPNNTGPIAANSPNTTPSTDFRPILEPTNIIKSSDRNSFRRNEHSFPPPQSLYSSKDTQVDPCFIRASNVVLHTLPHKTVLPIAAWFTPFASEQVHVVELNTPLRCLRCKAYVNPYFQFDGTRRSATCNMCGLRFQVDENVDKTNLQSTQIATQCILDFRVSDKFYYKKRTDIVKVIIAVELSMPIMELGILPNILNSLKSVFESHQFEEKVRVGVVFYGDQGVGFIRPSAEEEEPVVFSVPNNKTGMVCCPLSDAEFMLDPNNQRSQLVAIVDYLQRYSQNVWKQGRFSHTANYIYALKCISQSFEQETGRILLFSCLDPRAGPCSIRPRTEDESKSPLKPIHNQTHEFAKELLRSRIGVEHFFFGKDGLVSHELATNHFLSSSTGGGLHNYTHYNAQTHGEHLYYSIYHSLTKVCHYDVDFTCRASNGLSVLRYGVPDGVRESRDVSLSVVDATSSFTVEFDQEDKLQENLGAFLQFALMYTTAGGERRIRVINYKFEVSPRLQPVYDSLDYLTFANVMARTYASKLLKQEPTKLREDAITWLGSLLGEFVGKGGNSLSSKVGSVSVPRQLAWAVSYIGSIFNSRMFLNYVKMNADNRIVEYLRINSLNPYFFAVRCYPKLYPLTLDIYESDPLPGDFIDEEGEEEEGPRIAVLPKNLMLSKPSLSDSGVYLYDSGDQLTVLVQGQASEDLLIDLFGTSSWEDIELGGLPELQTAHSIRVANIVAQIRRRSSKFGGMYQPLIVRTPLKKGPYGELISNLLKQDFFECTLISFLGNLAGVITVPK